MWETKRAEEMDLAARDVEEVCITLLSESEHILILITLLVVIVIIILSIFWVFRIMVISTSTSITVFVICINFVIFISKPIVISSQVKEMSRIKMFGRPGNGAPTGDVRKKKFTEHQLDTNMIRSHLGWCRLFPACCEIVFVPPGVMMYLSLLG